VLPGGGSWSFSSAHQLKSVVWRGRDRFGERWRRIVAGLWLAMTRTIRTMTSVAIVDDEANIRETVAFALRREGYQVATFADGAEAWAIFEETLPDVVVLDILM